MIVVAFYKIVYLLFHLIVAIHNFDTIDLKFTTGYSLEKLLMRVVFDLIFKLIVYHQRLQSTYRFQSVTHKLIG